MEYSLFLLHENKKRENYVLSLEQDLQKQQHLLREEKDRREEILAICKDMVTVDTLKVFWERSEGVLKDALITEVKQLFQKASSAATAAAQQQQPQRKQLLLDVKLLSLMYDVIRKELETEVWFCDQVASRTYPAKNGNEISIFNKETRIIGDLEQVDDFVVFQLAAQVLLRHIDYLDMDVRAAQNNLNSVKEKLAESERQRHALQLQLEMERKRATAAEASAAAVTTQKRERENDEATFTYERLNKIRKEQTDNMNKVLDDSLVLPKDLPPDYMYMVDCVLTKVKSDVQTAFRKTHAEYFGLIKK